MIINKAAKDIDMTPSEKNEKEIQTSYNSKYKSWVALLRLLETLEKHNYHGRLRLFGRFGSVVRGASSPRSKHENLRIKILLEMIYKGQREISLRTPLGK